MQQTGEVPHFCLPSFSSCFCLVSAGTGWMECMAGGEEPASGGGACMACPTLTMHMHGQGGREETVTKGAWRKRTPSKDRRLVRQRKEGMHGGVTG